MNDNAGDTPLIHAARQGHTSFSLYLLEHGADACATPSENQPSVLHHAAGTGLFLPLQYALEENKIFYFIFLA